jgi:hypothetical protein
MGKGTHGTIAVSCTWCGGTLYRRASRVRPQMFCDQAQFHAWRVQQGILSFWDKVAKTEACWLWTKGTDKHGYGKVQHDNRTRRAHQRAWELTYGSIPAGLMVCHSCDNPPCVNPEHLFLGTNSDNQQDAIRKGRKHGPTGEECSWRKVTEAQAAEIARLRGVLPQRQIARQFGITQSTVCRIQVARIACERQMGRA